MARMGGGQHETRMPDWQRRILQENRGDLASDLDVNYIMNYMIQKNILTTAMYETVMSNPTTIARTEAFLDLLPTRGEKAFSTFLGSLEETYPHLHQTLTTAVGERERRMNMESEIYEEVDIETPAYLEPTQTVPLTQLDHPQSYVTPLVGRQGDSGLHNKEVHPTVEITADVQGDVVEKRSRQAGNMYQGLVSGNGCGEASGGGATASGGGAIAAICVRTPKIGDFFLTGERVLIKKGSPAVAHDTFTREGLAVVMYRLKFVCIPLCCVQEYGDPEGEKWYSPIPLAPAQAEHMLKTESVPGLFVAYTPTWKSEMTPYQISLRLSSGIVKHYPVYKFNQGQLAFKNEQVNFKNLKDLVEYHKQNRGILECRLKKSLREIDETTTFGKIWEIDHGDVDFEDAIQLGTGCFSTLHQALYKNKIVVVKKPKSDAMSKESIVEEAQVLMPLKHSNIVRLLGVIRRDEPSLVIECLHDGDLSGWLKKTEVLNTMTRLTICLQVVAGVAYLHEQRYVLHRDIAAHNCQVMSSSPSKVLIKLADFSMARCVKDDCYYAEKEEKQPIRWSAPEVLLEGKYTTKSDTWGVGLVMWEVYTNGEKPFASLKKEEVKHMVVEVRHSPMSTDRPARCPREVSEIIEKCFEYDPTDRPAMTMVGDELAACKEVVSGDSHHLQPVDRSYALRQTLSYCDLTGSQDDNSGIVRGSPGRGGILNRFRKGNRK